MKSDSELKLSELKLKLNEEMIGAYEGINYEFKENAKKAIQLLQSSRKENTGDDIVKIEMKLDNEYRSILNFLFSIERFSPIEDFRKQYIETINKNKELLSFINK